MGQERYSGGRFKPAFSDEELTESVNIVAENNPVTVASTADVHHILTEDMGKECSLRTVSRRLNELHDEGDIEKLKPGANEVFWGF